MLTRRRMMIASAAGGTGALSALAAAAQEGGENVLTGGDMALSQATKVADKLWIGPKAARSDINSPPTGAVFMGDDTQVDYYWDGSSWNAMGVGSSEEPVPEVTPNDFGRSEVPMHGADFSVKQLAPRGDGDYRAVGRDGERIITTNDAGEAIQACIDTADTDYQSMVSIQLSGGFFTIGTTVESTRAFELRGQGRNRTFIDGFAQPHFRLNNGVPITEIKHMKWSGADGRAVQITSAKEFNALNVEWRDCKQAAIHYDMNSGEEEFWSELTSCWLLQNGASNPTASDHGGLVFQNASGGAVQEFNVNGGYFDSNHDITDDDGNSTYGPALRVASGSNLRNLNVTGTTFKHNKPVVFAGGTQMSLTGCHFRNIQSSNAIEFVDLGSATECGTSVSSCVFESDSASPPNQHALIGANWDGLDWANNVHVGSSSSAYLLAYNADMRVSGGNLDKSNVGGTRTRLRVNGRGRNSGDPSAGSGQWAGYAQTVADENLVIEDTTNNVLHEATSNGSWA